MLRRFLVVAVACAWLAGCGGQSSAPINSIPQFSQRGKPLASPSPNGDINELPEPPSVRPVHGVAKISLVVNLNGATGLPEFVFNGMNNVAPTIRVNPGDTIVIDESNDLPPTRGDKYDINLHFHGLGSSPLAPGDDVLGMLARPGGKLHYVVHIPKNQEPGLYWYHPHVHGETNYQVGEGGMSGALVINGLEKHLPELAKMKERVIVVRDTGIGANAGPYRGGADVDDMDGMGAMGGAAGADGKVGVRPETINNNPCGPELGLTPTLNGAYRSDITIAPGEKQFFRVINATGHKTLKLAVDGTKLEVVAIDGFALDSWPGTPPTMMETTAIVPPAARVEFVVTGPRGNNAKFRSECFDSGPGGDRDPDVLLANMVPPQHGAGNQSKVWAPLKVGAPLPQNAYTTPLPPVSVHRDVVFSEGPNRFFINHKAFSPSDPPTFVVHTGTVEEWHVANVSQEVHDFHLHQAHFLVKEINGVKVTHPHWADSVVIPHRFSIGHPGTLLMLMDFRDPIIKGTFLFHCHILDHEDRGMMAKIQAI